MRILYFIDTLIAGGRERRVSELLKGVNKIPEIEFEIVLMNEDVHYQEIFCLNKNIHFLIRNSKFDLSVFRKFFSIAKEFKPDIIHSWGGMTSIIAVPTCKLLKIILVNGMVMDTPVKRNILNKYWLQAKLSFPFSDMIIGNSKAGLTAYGAPVKKSLCIYNGMDLSRFENLKDPEEVKKKLFGEDLLPCFIAGMVAKFEPRKDYDTLIKGAISLIKANDDICFVLVGDGPDLPAIKSYVPTHLKNKILFLGARSDVESIINIFDVGILLTNSKVHGEGISNSIIEYMALGKPVIATEGGGTNEVVKDNDNGFLIRFAALDQLVDSVEKLKGNQNLIARLGQNGLQLSHTKFDLKIMTKHYIDMYRELKRDN